MKTMNSQSLRIIPFFLLLILSIVPSKLALASDDIRATLIVAEGEFTVGDRIPLTLMVTHPADYRLLPLPFQDSAWGAFEILDIDPPQVVANPDGTETSTQLMYVTAWVPGEYDTPQLPVSISDTSGEIHEIGIAPVSLRITSVLVEGDTELRDIKPQASLPLPALWPWLVGGMLGVLLVALVSGWLLRRWWLQRKAALANAPDNRLPHEVAFDELAHIEGLNLPTQQRFKEHYTLVSDVVRQYVEKSFQIATMDRTTDEIRRSIKLAPFNQDDKRSLIQMLNEADLVKFAKMQPEIGIAQNYLSQARQFIAGTKPPDVVTDNGFGGGHKNERIDFQNQNTPLIETK